MNLYADTSGLAKIVLAETGAEQLEGAIGTAERLTSAAVAYAELRAAVATAIRVGRVSHDDRPAFVEAVNRLWDSVHEIPIEQPLIRSAGNLADTFDLRGYDAIHLAALQVAGAPGELLVACWDRDLRRAAGGLGYELVPERL